MARWSDSVHWNDISCVHYILCSNFAVVEEGETIIAATHVDKIVLMCEQNKPSHKQLLVWDALYYVTIDITKYCRIM